MNIPLFIAAPLIVCGIKIAKHQYADWKFMQSYKEINRKSTTAREFLVCDKMLRDYQADKKMQPLWSKLIRF